MHMNPPKSAAEYLSVKRFSFDNSDLKKKSVIESFIVTMSMTRMCECVSASRGGGWSAWTAKKKR